MLRSKSFKETIFSVFNKYAPIKNSFKETILSVFNKYAPIKKEYIRANEAPFMTKNLHKEIMKRSRLRNKYLKSKSLTDRKNYNIQRNFCKKLLRTTEKEYFNNLDTKKVTDNKTFYRTVVSTFSNKNSKSDKITLNEEDKTVSDKNYAELSALILQIWFLTYKSQKFKKMRLI